LLHFGPIFKLARSLAFACSLALILPAP